MSMNRKQIRKKQDKQIQKHLKSCAGMTITEMLAAVLILTMTMTAISGGVFVVGKAYKKTTEKAEAQMVLATTVELITDFLSDAQQVQTGSDGGPVFYSPEAGAWMRLGRSTSGICKIYCAGAEESGAEASVPIMTEEAMAGIFYTDFAENKTDGNLYEYSDGCFTVKNINVYDKTDADNPDRVPVAHLDELVVRAVNLEGQ